MALKYHLESLDFCGAHFPTLILFFGSMNEIIAKTKD